MNKLGRPSKYKIYCPDCSTETNKVMMFVCQTKNYKGVIQKHFKCPNCYRHLQWRNKPQPIWIDNGYYEKPVVKESSVQKFIDKLIKEENV